MAVLYHDIENDGLYDGYKENNYLQEKGAKGEQAVRDLLVESLSEEYLVLNSIYSRTDDGDFTEIDHVLLHSKFILCIETKHYSGDMKALDLETWEQRNRKNGETIKIDSPQQQSVHHAYSLNGYLESIDIQIPIYTVVVFVNDKTVSFDESSDQYYKSECPVIYMKNLLHLIEVLEHLHLNDQGNSTDVKNIADQILDEHQGIKNSQLFWCKKSAMNENDREAQYILGQMYLSGYYEEGDRLIRIKSNERAALYWLTKASKRGHKLARQALNRYYNN